MLVLGRVIVCIHKHFPYTCIIARNIGEMDFTKILFLLFPFMIYRYRLLAWWKTKNHHVCFGFEAIVWLKNWIFSTSWRGWITAVDIWRFLVVSGCRILVRTFSTFGSEPDRQKDNAWGGPPFSKSVGKWSRGSILGIPWCLNKFGLSKKKSTD